MKRRERNIEIFSMSVLDLFASALGGFLLISIILFPYYQRAKQIDQIKEEKSNTEKKSLLVSAQLATDEVKSKGQQIALREGAQFAGALRECKVAESQCRSALSSTFLVIGIEWDKRCDVDLYVTDPEGSEFSFSNKVAGRARDAKSEAELSLDMVDGPGIEIWQNPKAIPGDYRIRVNGVGGCGRAGAGEQVDVKGWIIDRAAGLQVLPTRVLDGPYVTMARLRVNADGSTSVLGGAE